MAVMNLLAKVCVFTTDLATFNICVGCDALLDLSDYPSPKPSVEEVICRWSAVAACMFSTIDMLIDPNQRALTLRFRTAL